MYPFHTLYTFPTGNFLENLHPRPDGQILFTSMSLPHLYSINPNSISTTSKPHLPTESCLVHQFPAGKTLSGITEIGPDVFAVNVGKFGGFKAEPGSHSIWIVDMTNVPDSFDCRTAEREGRKGDGPVVKKVVDVTSAGLINGLTSLPPAPDRQTRIVLAADSMQGRVYAIDLDTATFEIMRDDPQLAPSNSEGTVPLGINGLRVSPSGQWLYITNSATGIFGRYPLSTTGSIIGDLEILAKIEADMTHAFDDFCVDADGTSYITTHPNGIYRVTPDGEQKMVAGGEGSEIVAPTSCCLVESKVKKGGEAGKSKEGGRGKWLIVTCGMTFADGVRGGGRIVVVELEL